MRYYIGLFHFIAMLMTIPVPAFVYAVEPDAYEQDNTFAQARVIILKDDNPQIHSFHEGGDQDWVKFYGLEGKKYEIRAGDKENKVGTDCDVVIELYDITGVNLVGRQNAGLEGEAETLTSEPLPADGIYYIKVYNDSQTSGGNTGYELRLTLQNAPVSARFQGSTTDAISKAPLGNVMIKTEQNFDSSFSALSDNGNYTMYHPISNVVSQNPSDAYDLTARLPGYEIFTIPVFTSESCSGGKSCFKTLSVSGGDGQRTDPEIIEWDGVIELIPLGDITGDHKIDLADVISGLQVLTGTGKVRADYIKSGADISGDNKIGMEEVLHILHILQNQETE